ncbi:hypothetical protein QEN19_002960 [Hanseniaspora menglaensis]
MSSQKVFAQTFPQTHQNAEITGLFSLKFPATGKSASQGTQLIAKDTTLTPDVKVLVSSDHNNGKFTLILSDIDASAEGCHYLATNLTAVPSENDSSKLIINNKSEGVVDILPFVAPGPRIDQNHAYVWLLFEGVPSMESALNVRDCRRGYGMNEKDYGAEWFQKISGLGKLVAFDYIYVKNNEA